MQHIDKFWTAFRDKLASFQPDAYTDNDWQEMELLLNGAAATPIKKPFLSFWKSKKVWVLLLLLFASIAGAYSLWINHIHEDGQSTLTKGSKDISVSLDQSVAQVEEKEEIAVLPITKVQANDQNNVQSTDKTSLKQLTDQSLDRSIDRAPEIRQTVLQNSTLPSMVEVMDSKNSLAVVEDNTNTTVSSIDVSLSTESKRDFPIDDLGETIQFLPIVETADLMSDPYSINDTVCVDTKVTNTWQKAMNYGFSLSTTNYNTLGKSRIGGSVGVAYQRKLNNKWSMEIIPTVRWVRVDDSDFGFEASDTSISINGYVGISDIERSLSSYMSFDLPIQLSYHLNERWSVQGGVRGSLLVPFWFEYKYRGQGIKIESQDIESYKSAYMLWPVDVGIIMGVRYAIDERWALGFRYNQGFIDITPDNLYLKNITNTNSDLQLSVYRKF
jgi:hypothetical protein